MFIRQGLGLKRLAAGLCCGFLSMQATVVNASDLKLPGDVYQTDIDVLVNGVAVIGEAPFKAIEVLLTDLMQGDANRRRAFEILESVKPDFEGEPDFDALYGELALEFGDVGESIFALSRALIYVPDDEKLKALLETAQLRADRIKRNLAYEQRPFKGRATIGWVYDSNINSGTELKQFFFPGAGFSIVLDENQQRRAGDAWVFANRFSYQATPRLFSSFDVKHKMQGDDVGDQTIYTGRMSYALGQLKQPWVVSLAAQLDTFDNSDERTTYVASMGKVFTSELLPIETKFFAHAMQFAYEDPVSDKNQYLAGAGISYSPTREWTHELSGVIAQDDPKDAVDGAKFARDLMGLTYRNAYEISKKQSLKTLLSFNEQAYQGFSSGLLESRVDEVLTFDVSYSLNLTDYVETILSYRFVNNRSNIELFNFDKHIGAFALAYRY